MRFTIGSRSKDEQMIGVIQTVPRSKIQTLHLAPAMPAGLLTGTALCLDITRGFSEPDDSPASRMSNPFV